MALTLDEVALLEAHYRNHTENYQADQKMSLYAEGEQVVETLGMAVPESFRDFMFVLNWPGTYVEAIEARQDVRSLILPGEERADPRLVEMWDANNLDSELSLFLWDRYVYGRSFFSVGANEDDSKMPLIHVESPREMTAMVDVRRRQMTSAAKFYGTDQKTGISPTDATLYLPNETIWVLRSAQTRRWEEVDRDHHRLGRVPVTMSLAGRRSGSWTGRPLITRVNDLTDAVARAYANMQFASEATGIPRIAAIGMTKSDFVDPDGKSLPTWASYFQAIWATANKDAKFHQFTAADLKNFDTQVTLYAKGAQSVTKLPARTFGITTTNPPSADAIRAEEAEFVPFITRQNRQVGAVIGWTSALWMRFATGDWIDGSRVGVEWHDPATPTIAQREDALAKRRAAGVLSREGYWDELGWSEPRKSKERTYLESEADDEVLNRVLRGVDGGVTSGDTDLGV